VVFYNPASAWASPGRGGEGQGRRQAGDFSVAVGGIMPGAGPLAAGRPDRKFAGTRSKRRDWPQGLGRTPTMFAC